jgi:hypothetical protein
MSQSKVLTSEIEQGTPSRGVPPLRTGTSPFGVRFLCVCIALTLVSQTGERVGRQCLAVRATTKRVLVRWVEGTLVRSVAVPRVPVRVPAAAME